MRKAASMSFVQTDAHYVRLILAEKVVDFIKKIKKKT